MLPLAEYPFCREIASAIKKISFQCCLKTCSILIVVFVYMSEIQKIFIMGMNIGCIVVKGSCTSQ